MFVHVVCDFFQRKVAGRPDKTHEVRCTLPAHGYFKRSNGLVVARCAKHNPNLIRQVEGTDPNWIEEISQDEYIVGHIMQS